jgi:hypothetical protein
MGSAGQTIEIALNAMGLKWTLYDPSNTLIGESETKAEVILTAEGQYSLVIEATFGGGPYTLAVTAIGE